MEVEIIPPDKWYKKTKYRLLKPELIHGVWVPKDFVTDGASIPRFLWCFLPPTSVYFYEAVLHDYLVRTNVLGSRTAADDYFYKSLLKKHSKVLSTILYKGARIGTVFKEKLGIDLVGK